MEESERRTDRETENMSLQFCTGRRDTRALQLAAVSVNLGTGLTYSSCVCSFKLVNFVARSKATTRGGRPPRGRVRGQLAEGGLVQPDGDTAEREGDGGAGFGRERGRPACGAKRAAQGVQGEI